MASPIRILLQTTIPSAADDWNIGRFSMLHDYLAELTDEEGAPLCDVTARDRTAPGSPDPILSTIDRSDYDELWLFAVDTGDGLDPEDCAAIGRFREGGGGLLVTRDHMDLVCSVCTLGGVGAAHFFHSSHQDPDPSHRVIAKGVSKVSGRQFNLAVAFEPSSGDGPAIAESTFHHFADYNWDPEKGCPSFVSELPGDGLAHSPEARASIRTYVRNLALWLARRSPDPREAGLNEVLDESFPASDPAGFY